MVLYYKQLIFLLRLLFNNTTKMMAYSCKADKPALEAVLKGNANFSFNVYQMLRQQKEGDLLFSPVLLQTALGLLQMGANSTTSQQIASALQLPEERTLVQNGFKALLKSLKNIKHTTMNMITRVFIPDGIVIDRDFFMTAGKTFDVKVKPTDFHSNVEATRVSVNTEVKKSTRNKVDEIVPKGKLEYWTRLLVVSGVHFQCKLAVPFLAVDTTSDLFHVSNTDSRSIKIMHRTDDFRYGEFDELKARVLEIPYKTQQLSLILMLPYSVDGLPYLEDKLNSLDLNVMLGSMQTQRVKVSIPSFKFDEAYDLTDTFTKMGLSGLTDAQLGDLKGLAEVTPPLTLTLMAHKVCMEVSEEGSEPIVAGVVRVPNIPGVKPKEFRADHPFIFAVLDNYTGAILFLGHLSCSQRFSAHLLRESSAQRLSCPPSYENIEMI